MKKEYLLFFLIMLFMTSLYANENEETDNTVDLDLMAEAWTIPTGGSNNRPYYSLEVNGVCFAGERPWKERWNLLKDAMDYKNARVLELGCNVGLASVYLMKYREALSCTGVDRPDDELAIYGMPRLMEASYLLQKAFGVNVDIFQLDLNQSNYEEILGTDYDVVICMSILKWVYDKQRFLNYLSQFNHIIFEGHEPDEIEVAKFQKYGFDYEILGSTQIGISYPLDQTRTLIHFWKKDIFEMDTSLVD